MGRTSVLQRLEFLRDELMWTFENDSLQGIGSKWWEEWPS